MGILSKMRDDWTEMTSRAKREQWKHEREMKMLEIEAKSSSNANAPEPIVWKGTLRELANEIIRLRENGKIEAPADDKLALEKYVPHFVRKKNGEIKAIDTTSMWKNYSDQINSKSS